MEWVNTEQGTPECFTITSLARLIQIYSITTCFKIVLKRKNEWWLILILTSNNFPLTGAFGCNWKHFVRIKNNYKARSQQMTSQENSWTLGICGSSPVQIQLMVESQEFLQSHVSKPVICHWVTGGKIIKVILLPPVPQESSFYTLRANTIFILILLLNSWIISKLWCKKLFSLFVLWDFKSIDNSF